MLAGALSLQAILECLTSLLQKAVSGQAPPGQASLWQCRAASVITVMTEILFGTSAIWQPLTWLDLPSRDAPAAEAILPMLEQLQEMFVCDELWGIASHNEASGDQASQPSSPQVRDSMLDVCSSGMICALRCRLWIILAF